MTTVTGLATARGLACGSVFIYRGDGEIPIPEYVVEPGREREELDRLRSATASTRSYLENLIRVLKERTGRNDVRVFECHLMLLEDEILAQETEGHVIDDHLNAEAAVRRTMDGARAQFAKMNDPYFRERVRDIDDVERRLLSALTGVDHNPLLGLKTPSIIIAHDLTPSETVQLPREFVLGFATNGGSTTSHVAMLARALAIPAVTGLGDITRRVSPGETILLDGTVGTVTLSPDAETIASYEKLIARQHAFFEVSDDGVPAGTLKEGGEIKIVANIHPGVPFVGLKEQGARGVGLYRSEFLWLNREIEPPEEEQFKAYQLAARLSHTFDGDASVTIRTLDIGGDKIVRGVNAKEANPFLGNRSIRYLLSHREVFHTQLRAILRASAFGKVKIMYPMVSCVEELTAAEAELNSVRAELDAAGIPYDRDVDVGAMIEVPSAALNAESLAGHVQFFSIGTNDLVQYTMAADRGNDAVAYLYQPLNPAIIKLVKMTVAAAKQRGISVSVCGESASDPVVGIYWAAIGVDTLSMSATFIPFMSKTLQRLTRADLDEYARVPDTLPADATAKDVFDACRAWLVSKIPELEEVS